MVGFWIYFFVVLTGSADGLDVDCEESEANDDSKAFGSSNWKKELDFIKLMNTDGGACFERGSINQRFCTG